MSDTDWKPDDLHPAYTRSFKPRSRQELNQAVARYIQYVRETFNPARYPTFDSAAKHLDDLGGCADELHEVEAIFQQHMIPHAWKKDGDRLRRKLFGDPPRNRKLN